MKFQIAKLLVSIAIMCLATNSVLADTAEWTLMVFMNGKNSLEADALANFREIAAIGSTSKVNVVVEMGRPSAHVTHEAEGWSGVLRFNVKKGQAPVPASAVLDLRRNPALSDMGSPAALDDFINWSLEKYPAKKYMLVIWNHGQGWRFQMADDESIRDASTRIPPTDRTMFTRLSQAAEHTPQVGGYRAVSFDDDTKHFLYNSDVQKSIANASSRLKRKLDIVGFDACLMSMLETGYGFRTSAALMVSSEELEPGPGWDYTAIMGPLVRTPTMTPLDLSSAVVAAYKNRYGDHHMTTLSVVDLSKIEATADAVSSFADALLNSIDSERAKVEQARSKLTTYGAGDGLYTSIDLPSFLELYIAETTESASRTRAQAALDLARQTVVINYASATSVRATGSKGIAIYFPASKSDFDADPYKQGYVKTNSDHPVDFVSHERWSDFLQIYLR
ncbi:hypothetical protein UP10_28455 [Bradyrhizobium sp. LTSPM299]|uniref:clostripain-related cysteine peptidase n=1 Tax=Bradyrhizobium sp. LTSPM299 TaxID=1619233 RepID=UPI0005CAE961|nr:clostripain-related cysteine peptidase [Bradyrhizobium sp. LTSPM299]KJC57516.1 hypothetical protein UP10_28455 [Bradyrhizobium sp. LTSPM299]